MEGIKDAAEQEIEELHHTVEDIQWIIDNPSNNDDNNITSEAKQKEFELLKRTTRDKITEIWQKFSDM